MLASQFSGRWEDSMKKDEEGRILLDYDPPDEFALTLKELRHCAMDPDPPLKMPDPSLEVFWKYMGLVPTPPPEPSVFSESVACNRVW